MVSSLYEDIKAEELVEGIQGGMTRLVDEIEEWWSSEGFFIVNDVRFLPTGGVKMWLGLFLDTSRSQNDILSYRHRMENDGLDMFNGNVGSHMILDTTRSRRSLKALIDLRFESATIARYDSYANREQPGCYLQGIEVLIPDLRAVILTR